MRSSFLHSYMRRHRVSSWALGRVLTAASQPQAPSDAQWASCGLEQLTGDSEIHTLEVSRARCTRTCQAQPAITPDGTSNWWIACSHHLGGCCARACGHGECSSVAQWVVVLRGTGSSARSFLLSAMWPPRARGSRIHAFFVSRGRARSDVRARACTDACRGGKRGLRRFTVIQVIM